MSVRLEWGKAEYCSPTVYRKGDELGDGNTVTENFALVFGTQVIEGSATELRNVIVEASLRLTRISNA